MNAVASMKEIKLTLRAHIELRMRDFRELDFVSDQYKHIAYGAVWAGSWAKAITDQERDAYIAELYSSTKKGSAA